MAYLSVAAQWGGVHLAQRFARSIPYLGAAVVVVTLGITIQRKGLFGGLANAGFDAIPFVGAGKNAIEWLRGEDFFPDRPAPITSAQRHRRRAPERVGVNDPS